MNLVIQAGPRTRPVASPAAGRSLLVVLQNAYSTDPSVASAEGGWPHRSWVRALHASRSGCRLRAAVGEDHTWGRVSYCNTTRAVGDRSSSRLPPDPAYVRRVLRSRRPDVVLACGLQAREVVGPLWGGPLLCIPHPASRTLTNALLAEAAALLPTMDGRATLAQLRGRVEYINLEEVACGIASVGSWPSTRSGSWSSPPSPRGPASSPASTRRGRARAR